MKQSKKIFIPLAIAITCLVIGVTAYMNLDSFSDKPEISQNNSQEMATKALEYINQNLLQQDLIASLVNVENTEDGVFKVSFLVNEQELDAYITENGRFLFTEFFDMNSTPPSARKEQENQDEVTIGGFFKSKDKICTEDGKPIIYFFGSENCPHCTWEAPVIEAVAAKFPNTIVFHNNKGAKTDMEIFSQYSSGGVPTLVMGCQYYRVGSGEMVGQAEETKILTALICKLTNNQPTNVCGQVQDLINKI